MVTANAKAADDAGAQGAPALGFQVTTLDGKDANLADYRGKVVLFVNVASKCGLTPQYKDLQALHEKYGAKGLCVVGFPCNQFGAQEPGSPDEIREFCTANYGVKFDLFGKIEVNGDSACDFYKHLTALETQPKGAGKIGWNFEKFLIGRNGEIVARFDPNVEPTSDEVVKAIEAELAKK